jgi:hypothetical protein
MVFFIRMICATEFISSSEEPVATFHFTPTTYNQCLTIYDYSGHGTKLEHNYKDIMKRRQKIWYSPPKAPKPKMPQKYQDSGGNKAKKIIESFLKPKHIKPPPEYNYFSYIVDIYAKWYQSYFHFSAKYHCPAPNCVSPFFESKMLSNHQRRSSLLAIKKISLFENIHLE